MAKEKPTNSGASACRREFLKSAAWLAILGVSSRLSAQQAARPEEGGELPPLPTQALGVLGRDVTRLGLSGWSLGERLDSEEASRAIERALELGVTLFDTAPTYGQGRADRLLGRGLSGRRRDAVVVSKTFQRQALDAERELDETLERLGTDYVDVWMFHAVSSVTEADALAARGGAVQAARRALDDGRVLGLGAHGTTSPEALNHLAERVPEVQVLMCPVNCLDPHWRSFTKTTLPMAQERGLDVLGRYATAMEGVERTLAIDGREAKRYTLSQPIASWISDIQSVRDLETDAALVRAFDPMSEEEQAVLIKKSEPFSGPAYEVYKTWGDM